MIADGSGEWRDRIRGRDRGLDGAAGMSCVHQTHGRCDMYMPNPCWSCESGGYRFNLSYVQYKHFHMLVMLVTLCHDCSQ
jgi:hypothetical protein